MCDSGIEDFPAADDDALAAGMERAAALDLPVAVHAEDPASLTAPAGHRLARLRRLTAGRGGARRDRTRICGWRGRPAARCTSCTSAPPAASRASSKHARHRRHLRDLPALPHAHRRGPRAPRHAREVRAAAAQRCTSASSCGRRSATSRFVASDHSPCPPDMKRGDFTAAWGGIAGCQTLLPLLLDSGRLTLEQVAMLTSANPARRLPAAQGHGPRSRRRPRARRHARSARARRCTTATKLSPFAGRALRGRVVRTLLRGTTVFHDGEIVGHGGRLLTPTKGDT